MTEHPTPTHEVVYRNVSSGGRVVRVSRVKHFDAHTAQAEAQRRNERDGRAGRNVCWTTREVGDTR